jgi:hypothetical protein
MMNLRKAGGSTWLLLGLGAILFILGGAEVQAAKLKLKAQLIWGTDHEKPKNDPNIKELDPKLRDKLRKIRLFSWKNFFEVDRQFLNLPHLGSNITSLSHECVIEVEHLGNTNIKVRLYGEGKLVQTVSQNLPKGEYLILAGDVKKKITERWIIALSVADP